jgi:hypothetical protein
MRSRGIRRHHEERVKARVRSYYGGYAVGDPRSVGRIAHTRRLCSCWMCGNPRRYWKQATFQELRVREVIDS